MVKHKLLNRINNRWIFASSVLTLVNNYAPVNRALYAVQGSE